MKPPELIAKHQIFIWDAYCMTESVKAVHRLLSAGLPDAPPDQTIKSLIPVLNDCRKAGCGLSGQDPCWRRGQEPCMQIHIKERA
jgi:hypothetical protein